MGKIIESTVMCPKCGSPQKIRAGDDQSSVTAHQFCTRCGKSFRYTAQRGQVVRVE